MTEDPSIGEAAQQLARFRMLADASHAFAEVALDYSALLSVLSTRAAQLIGDGAIVNLLAEDRKSIVPISMFAADAQLARDYTAMATSTRARLDDSVAGRVISQNAPVRMADLDPRVVAESSRPEWREVIVRMNVHSYLVVPMRVRGMPIGSISLFRSAPGRPYKDVDEELLQDLADRGALAVENARLHESVEQRVEERTRELNFALGELSAFSYSVSHDLRAPLRAIDGFSHALLEEYGSTLEPGALDYLRRVTSAAGRMNTLIDALLLLSRMSRGTLHRERVDLSSLAKSVLDRLAQSQPARALDTTIDPNLEAEGDARLLDVVLTNLIGNAWKFTSKSDRAKIQVSSLPEQPRVFVVRDNGAGFDPRYAGKLFRPFQRLHGAAEFDGTGIGLATVSRIVHRHGGRIWAEGQPGRGASFFFTLEGGPDKGSKPPSGPIDHSMF